MGTFHCCEMDVCEISCITMTQIEGKAQSINKAH